MKLSGNISKRFGLPPSVSRNSANMAPCRKSSGFVLRPFVHDILERRRVPHDTFEVLWTRQRYSCFLAIPAATFGFNLDLRPAIGLWRISQVANDMAGVFIRDSQGPSHEPNHTCRAAQLKLYCIVYIARGCGVDKRGRPDRAPEAIGGWIVDPVG
jgi:hypothetical protein